MLFTKEVRKGEAVLLLKNGEVTRVLTEGNYRTRRGETAEVFDMTKPFKPAGHQTEVLLQNAALRAALHVIEVADHEIVLRYDNNNFSGVLRPGRHLYWRGLTEYKFVRVDLSKKDITEDIEKQVLLRSEVRPYLLMYTVPAHAEGLLYADGKFDRVLKPGKHYFWDSAEPLTVLTADLRRLQTEINGQEILTKDKAGVRVNYVLHYRITDTVKALADTDDYAKQLYVLTQLALREYMSSYTLDEVLEKKAEASEYVQAALAERAAEFGLEVTGGGIKDIILPGEVREIMNRVLIAQKQAEANTIARREETASVRSLLNTAKLLEENDMLFRLKEMEYVEKIADKINGITVGGDRKVLDGLRDIFAVSGK